MLQDPLTIRHYQRITDDIIDLWHRGNRMEEIRFYVDGYLACLRQVNVLEIYMVHRLEEDVFRFLRDPSNFEYDLMPQTETEISL
jgi:hypothetical protein